ncbi:MAG: hypothetical protein V2I63_02285 [Pseudomonadales bacterium]|jgi:virginiamycin B lyase|nr:hypothetical protein [Pseudomonadales bacterium]
MAAERPLRAAALALVFASVQAAALPEGPGREQVEAVCTGCHETRLIENSSGYTEADWRALTATMIDLSGDEALRNRITGYLATHFPPNDRRTPTLVPGSAEIDIESWFVPTLGQRSRDPVEAPDGSIWWAGQSGNLIGRIDPATGAMREYPLPEGAMPHSVTPDAEGHIWYTGNKNGTLGRLDPATGEIKVYPMPDPEARDPHTAEFDAEGRLWFTLQQSNRVGRLDPETEEILLVELERPASRPYGIKIDAAGDAWVACNGGPCLYHFDGATMAATRIDLPNVETRVRRLDIAEDGTIWYVNSGAGRLGHFDPETGRIREWPSPSGPTSHPYALLVVDGIVWYNESGMRPDTLVRFDPQTEQFQSWPIPSSGVYGGILRHMRATRAGDLLIHQSGTNHIMRVTVADPPTRD